MLLVRSPAAARNISGEAIVSQPDEWCSPHQNSSRPSSSRWAARATSRWNINIGDSPDGWCGARNAPNRVLVIGGTLGGAVETTGLEPAASALQRRCAT